MLIIDPYSRSLPFQCDRAILRRAAQNENTHETKAKAENVCVCDKKKLKNWNLWSDSFKVNW